MKFIKVAKVYEKLKKAESDYRPVVMMAPAGYGKTATVLEYYKYKHPLVIRCKNGVLENIPDLKLMRNSVIIVDDVQWLVDEESIRYVRELFDMAGRQIVLLTRGAFPKYLADREMDLNCIRITEQDFLFRKEEIRTFFAEYGSIITEEDIGKVCEASMGYPRAVFYYAVRMEHGERYSEEMHSAVWQDVFHYWDEVMYEQWTVDFREFALSVCQYEKFSKKMAEELTGNSNVSETIEYCRTVTGQLQYLPEGYYAIRPEIRYWFQWKQEILWTPAEIKENFRKGAYYYEREGNIPDALKYYKKAEATQRVKELLIRNAQKTPGMGHYVETQEYYMAIPEEEIKNSPVLMAGMSMLYDLILQPELSEKWFQELVDFEENKIHPRELRREARARLAYLEITLPHRGINGIIKIIKNVFTLIKKGDIVLPEMSVTGNIPSIMNGGLDFSEWSKNDTQIARFMGKSVESVVGKYAHGLVTLALAESGFEKGTMSVYEVMTRCSAGYQDAMHGGKEEMCFVSVGIQARQHIVEGQIASARRVYKDFKELVQRKKSAQLYPNMEAFEIWLSLYDGAGAQISDYLNGAPREQSAFCTLDRYRSMMKLRCLIAQNELEEAIQLSNFLTGYFEKYERIFHWIENELLKSVILYRMGTDKWMEHLQEALKKAKEFHFVRVVSMEGAAVLPLLREYMAMSMKNRTSWEQQVITETGRIAQVFPDYLKYISKLEVVLTKRENEVLSMLCAGLTTDEICKECRISYDGLKKHNRSIYKKLGARNRAEAERKAVQLGLVCHREQNSPRDILK